MRNEKPHCMEGDSDARKALGLAIVWGLVAWLIIGIFVLLFF